MPANKWMTAAALTAALCMFGAPASGQARGPKTTKAPAAKGPSTRPTPAGSTASGPKAKGPSAKAGNAGAASSSARAGNSKKAPATTTVSAPTGTPTTGGTTPTTTTWTPDNPVARKLSTKPNQLARAQAVLPPGTDLNAATAGFKNFGQFNAAVNVSNNLGIPFADLKAAMTGITLAGDPTGEPTLSLGRAIQQLRPGADPEVEAHRAQTQASVGETAKRPKRVTTSASR
jgi:hypothetical protein